ncbi:MAG: hypothetical protein AAFX90_10245 [Pseudomonadota bacterium]
MFDHPHHCNEERMLAVQAAILDPGNCFSMATWGYCISGWAKQLFGSDEALGLSDDVAESLFIDQPRATRQQAAAAIDNVIATGSPRWAEVMP